ncbi:MAG: hypothetical protein IT288_01390 [Bdellovibrionales bacterium]|nr:hypothetical protein [Bdellovibrionales bacterium]
MGLLRKYRLHLIVMTAIVIYVGCSDVKFKSVPSDACANANEYGTNTCFEQSGWLNYHFNFKVGRVDILFVVDNSGSMYTEQTYMGDRFPNLLNRIANLDYQISLITTDVSASPGNNVARSANGYGSLQDGKFIKFPSGDYILNPLIPDVASQFRQTIRRNETLTCDNTSYTDCPSGDERGIYALNLALDRADARFFRPDSHLAVVILADEDERSNGGNISGYPLETYDLPLTFAQKVNSQLGKGKTVSVHSVIIRPGDSACLDQQNSQARVRGYYGTQYARLVTADADSELRGAHPGFLRGELGSICAADYGAQMGDIGSRLPVNANVKVLPCVPDADKIEVSFSPAPPFQIEFDVQANGLLTFSPQPPAGTEVSVDVSCRK